MIHVGVSSLARGIVLETCANSCGYKKPDANKCLADKGTSSLSNGCVECLKTDLDVKSLCEHLNQLNQDGKLKINSIISKDAGRYLCEYIYYTSMKCNSKNTLFVHVPEIDEKSNFTVEIIRDALQEILNYLTKQI